jgi:opacity protein-like surface antigen
MVKVFFISILWMLVSVDEVHAESGVIHVNPSVGYMKFDGDSELKNKVLPVIGVEYMMSGTYGVSVSFTHADMNVRDVREDASVSLYYMDGLYYLPRDKHWHPYLTGGIGHRRVKLNFSNQCSNRSRNETDTQLHFGDGVRYEASNTFTLRSEVRVLQNFNNDGVDAFLPLV